MTEQETELLNRLVVGHKRDGRRRYDPQAKRALIERALVPGVSVAGLALRYRINANLLRTWMRRYQDQGMAASKIPVARTLPAFIPVVPSMPNPAMPLPGLVVRLPNGVRIEIPQGEAEAMATLLPHLHALPCSGSTRG